MNLDRAAWIIKRGGIVAYPTETFYGLGGYALDPKAVSRLFKIKGREGKKPISILIGRTSELKKWANGVGEREKRLIKAFWPGPLTLVFKARSGVSKKLTGGTGKIGIRISSEPLARQLCLKVGGAITTTSANLSGQPSSLTANSVKRKIGSRLDGILSNRKLKRSKGSTILDVSSKNIKVIREGDISIARISEVLDK